MNFHLPYFRAFHAAGWEVHAACGGAPLDLPGADRVAPLPFTKRMSAPQNLSAAAALRRLIRTEGYQLISAHTSLASFFTRLALTGMGRSRPRMVNVVHGYLFDGDTPPAKRAVLLAAERMTAPVTDLTLTMNRWDFALAQEKRLGKAVDLLPGIGVDFQRLQSVGRDSGAALRRELGLTQDQFVLLFGAEFSPRKNQAMLIRALPLLPHEVRLLLPGDGALRGACMELAQKLEVAERVLFPGQVDDMPRWYAASDVAVSSSRSEGLPFNIMEAMYAGLPVVASAVKGHQDLIDPGVSGLLYPFGDEAAFAGCVMELYGDPALSPRLTSAAAAQLPQYRLDAVLPQVMAAYGVPVPQTAALV